MACVRSPRSRASANGRRPPVTFSWNRPPERDKWLSLCSCLLDRLEAGSDPDVNRRLDARQAERDRLRVELEALDAAVKAQQAQDPKAVVARIKALSEAWVDLLESDRTGEARQLLAGIFPSGLAVFKTESKTEIDWRYEGDVIIPGEILAEDAGDGRVAGFGNLWLPGQGSNLRHPD
jgi:hypothetical protein